MKIKVLPIDDGPCGHYRLLWPAQELRRQGHEIEILPAADKRRLGVLVRNGVVTGARDPECDVLVLQRPTSRLFHDAIGFLQRHGVRIVIDMDDDYGALRPYNPAFAALHPKTDPDNNWDWAARACALADAAVVTTPALTRRYHGRQTFVVGNYVPEAYFEVPKPASEQVVLGWAGTMTCHAGDLAATRGGVAMALEGTDAVFRLVGIPQEISQVAEELRIPPTFSATGWVEFPDYPKVVAHLDVGIVPLDDNLFNTGKSILKGLEYAATGVPFVASPTAPYLELESHGIGITAGRPRAWRQALRRLLIDDEYRAEVREQNRTKAREFTIERNAHLFWAAWTGVD